MMNILHSFIAVLIKLIWNAMCLRNINLISLHTCKVTGIVHNFSLKSINERDTDPLKDGNNNGHLGYTFRLKTVHDLSGRISFTVKMSPYVILLVI